MRQKQPAAQRKTVTSALADGHGAHSPNMQKLFLLAYNRPGISAGYFTPDYGTEIRRESCQTTVIFHSYVLAR